MIAAAHFPPALRAAAAQAAGQAFMDGLHAGSWVAAGATAAAALLALTFLPARPAGGGPVAGSPGRRQPRASRQPGPARRESAKIPSA
jgi:hypothetical protein